MFPTCFLQVAPDQLEPPLIIQLMPDSDRFGRKTAVGKSNDDRPAGDEHAPQIAEYGDRIGQVIDRNCQRRAAEFTVRKG